MTTRQEFIDEARTWTGTKFVHQDRTKGKGVDCANFIAAVAEDSGATDDVSFSRQYRRRENGITMLALLQKYMDIVPEGSEVRRADILALCDERLRFPDKPKHLIIVTELEPYWKGIEAGPRIVSEHILDETVKRRIHSCWRVRGLED